MIKSSTPTITAGTASRFAIAACVSKACLKQDGTRISKTSADYCIRESVSLMLWPNYRDAG